jgi:hypothetical protein
VASNQDAPTCGAIDTNEPGRGIGPPSADRPSERERDDPVEVPAEGDELQQLTAPHQVESMPGDHAGDCRRAVPEQVALENARGIMVSDEHTPPEYGGRPTHQAIDSVNGLMTSRRPDRRTRVRDYLCPIFGDLA